MINRETIYTLAALGLSLIGCGEVSTPVPTRIPPRLRTILPVPIPKPSATKVLDCQAGKLVKADATPHVMIIGNKGEVYFDPTPYQFQARKNESPYRIGSPVVIGMIIGGDKGGFCETSFGLFPPGKDKDGKNKPPLPTYERIW